MPVCILCLQEYVDLYLDWLLNKSIAKQFNAFKKGFDLVMGESNLADLFTAREVELLICGDQVRQVTSRKFCVYDPLKLHVMCLGVGL